MFLDPWRARGCVTWTPKPWLHVGEASIAASAASLSGLPMEALKESRKPTLSEEPFRLTVEVDLLEEDLPQGSNQWLQG